jgi:hypothetical protein
MDKNLMWGLGAKDFMAGKDSLIFKVNGAKHKGYVQITLDEGADLYNVSIFTIRRSGSTMVKKVKYEIEGAYFDDLPGILEDNCY